MDETDSVAFVNTSTAVCVELPTAHEVVTVSDVKDADKVGSTALVDVAASVDETSFVSTTGELDMSVLVTVAVAVSVTVLEVVDATICVEVVDKKETLETRSKRDSLEISLEADDVDKKEVGVTDMMDKEVGSNVVTELEVDLLDVESELKVAVGEISAAKLVLLVNKDIVSLVAIFDSVDVDFVSSSALEYEIDCWGVESGPGDSSVVEIIGLVGPVLSSVEVAPSVDVLGCVVNNFGAVDVWDSAVDIGGPVVVVWGSLVDVRGSELVVV